MPHNATDGVPNPLQNSAVRPVCVLQSEERDWSIVDDVVHACLDADRREVEYPTVPSSLVPRETSHVPYRSGRRASIITPGVNADTSFRHSGWQPLKERTLKAMHSCGSTDSTLMRVKYCGANAYVLASKSTPGKYRIACDKCHCRWCVPCSTERRSLIASNLHDRMPAGRIRFLTLTLRADATPLKSRLDRLYKSFTRFRQNPKIRAALSGGVSMIEVTYNREQHHWHTHLHVLFSGNYLDQKLASLVWHNVTGDSFIVDVREVKRRDIAVGYVVKYAGKAVDASVTNNDTAYVEAIKAMHGRRTLATFGTWRHLDLSAPPEDGEEWSVIAPLHKLIERCNNGDEDARAVLATLRRDRSTLPLFTGDLDDG